MSATKRVYCAYGRNPDFFPVWQIFPLCLLKFHSLLMTWSTWRPLCVSATQWITLTPARFFHVTFGCFSSGSIEYQGAVAAPASRVVEIEASNDQNDDEVDGEYVWLFCFLTLNARRTLAWTMFVNVCLLFPNAFFSLVGSDRLGVACVLRVQVCATTHQQCSQRLRNSFAGTDFSCQHFSSTAHPRRKPHAFRKKQNSPTHQNWICCS